MQRLQWRTMGADLIPAEQAEADVRIKQTLYKRQFKSYTHSWVFFKQCASDLSTWRRHTINVFLYFAYRDTTSCGRAVWVWVNGWVCDCEWVCEWMRVSEWLSLWLWMSEFVCECECVNVWMCVWVSVWLSECVSEWVSEYVWVNEWVSEWKSTYFVNMENLFFGLFYEDVSAAETT
jgi:hypothetical protein